MILDAARVLIPFVIAFTLGIALAPVLAHYLYAHKAWKKKGGKEKGLGDTSGTPLFNELHKDREVNTPRMGGVLVWGTTLTATLILVLCSALFGGVFSDLDFLNRGQTWLPLFALVLGGCVGLIDDILEVTRGKGGLSLAKRLLLVGGFGLFAGWWFYAKLGVSAVGIPFMGALPLGPLFIVLFVLVTLAVYASGVIDGIDGLAGGVFAIIFLAYAGIAFSQNQIALAGFAATVAGGLFAFLWFNIPPARFYLSETGTMALTMALTLTAFSSDVLSEGVGVSILPIIAFPLFATVFTDVLQVFSKKVFKRKLFKIAPIHHHFEALGWPPYKVTMRYWVITIISGMFGVAIALLQ